MPPNCFASLKSNKSDTDLDLSDAEVGDLDSRIGAAVRDYIKELPEFFEDIPVPSFFNDMDRIEDEISGLDYNELKQYATRTTLRYNEALNELLEQELLHRDTLAEVNYLKSQLSTKDEDLIKVRLDLQIAADSINTLLREKADALWKLTEAKKELVDMSFRAVNLQQDLNARVRREKELVESLVTTPKTTEDVTRSAHVRLNMTTTLPNETKNYNENILRHNGRELNGVLDPTITHSGVQERSDNVNIVSSRTNVKLSDLQESSFCKQDSCNSDLCYMSFVEDENFSDDVNDSAEWRRLFFQSLKRNKILEKELAKAHGCSERGGVGMTGTVPQRGFSLGCPSAGEIRYRLRRSVAELGRLERELSVERERGLKQSQLELQLLKDVGHFTRRLKIQENMHNTLRVQWRADMKLSREKLLEELYHCRWTLGALTTRMKTIEDGADNHLENSETTMTAGLAAALEVALLRNEALLVEREEREASYKMELQSRVAEMEELTTALNELREQLRMLKGEHRSADPLSTCVHTNYGSSSTQDDGIEGNSREKKAF